MTGELGPGVGADMQGLWAVHCGQIMPMMTEVFKMVFFQKIRLGQRKLSILAHLTRTSKMEK